MVAKDAPLGTGDVSSSRDVSVGGGASTGAANSGAAGSVGTALLMELVAALLRLIAARPWAKLSAALVELIAARPWAKAEDPNLCDGELTGTMVRD